jgi:multimeric flavodoxin WrbA
MRVLGIGGSPRSNANSQALVQAILDGAGEAGCETEAVQLKDYTFSSCIGCERCRKDKACTGLNDGMSLLYSKIEAARGLVVATPVHFYNLSALMKAFIDRLYCYLDFDMESRPRGWSSRLADQGRMALVAAVAEQMSKQDMGYAIPAMADPLQSLGYDVHTEIPVFGLFDRGRLKQCSDILEHGRSKGRTFGEALRKG